MQKLPVSRARFGRDIIAEFMPPERASNKVVLIAPGAPGYPGGKEALMELLSKKGFWSFVPRYRGTWESNGTFLEFPPSDDLLIVLDELPVGFRDLWSGADHIIHAPEAYIIGGSTGGAAAMLLTRDPRVKKAVAISGVADWRHQEYTAEPLDFMSEYVPSAFGQAYRCDPSAWKKLAAGGFYNPVDAKDSLDGTKLLLIHAKDDKVVHPEPGEALAKEIGAEFVLLPSGGHMGAGSASDPRIWGYVERFFRD